MISFSFFIFANIRIGGLEKQDINERWPKDVYVQPELDWAYPLKT